MKRIVAIAGAFLVMFLIIGASIHAINHIDKVNERTREEEAAKEIAASIAATTEGTNIWEYLRSSTQAPVEEQTAPPVQEGVQDATETEAGRYQILTQYNASEPAEQTVTTVKPPTSITLK